MLFLSIDCPENLKLEKIYGTLTILFYVSPSSPQLKRISFFVKSTQKNHSLASDW